MALVTKGRTFVSGEVVTPTKLNTLVDSATVTQIVNADVAASAGIEDTKLATISTAGKVSGNAITSGTIGGSTAINTTGTVTSGAITANLTGNASTATTLQTARTIAISGDVTGTATSFNGGANIAIASAITADSIVNADINAGAAIADTKLATISTAGKVSNTATTATSANTANAIVARDASGNFSAGTITAAITGNASTATTLQTARTIAITGDVTGTATSFNGSANIAIASAITADSIVNADINAGAAIADTKLATISTAGKVSNTATTATSANTANAIVARDGAGAVAVGAITSGAISSTGNMTVTGAITASGNITAFSDERLKTNIETIPDALSLVKRLRGVRYDRTDTGEHQIGVIAQETLQVIPEVVIPVAETGYLSVAYGNIVAVLIEAIKELSAQVESLKK